jgi:hypothetical protein
VIEHIVRFSTECEHSFLAAQIEIPEQGHIEIASSGSAHNILWRVSDVIFAGDLDTRSIEERRDGLIIVPEIGVTSQIDPLSV